MENKKIFDNFKIIKNRYSYENEWYLVKKDQPGMAGFYLAKKNAGAYARECGFGFCSVARHQIPVGREDNKNADPIKKQIGYVLDLFPYDTPFIKDDIGYVYVGFKEPEGASFGEEEAQIHIFKIFPRLEEFLNWVLEDKPTVFLVGSQEESWEREAEINNHLLRNILCSLKQGEEIFFTLKKEEKRILLNKVINKRFQEIIFINDDNKIKIISGFISFSNLAGSSSGYNMEVTLPDGTLIGSYLSWDGQGKRRVEGDGSKAILGISGENLIISISSYDERHDFEEQDILNPYKGCFMDNSGQIRSRWDGKEREIIVCSLDQIIYVSGDDGDEEE